MNETTDELKTEPLEQAAKAVRYTQEEANYLLESPTPNEHCASCRWFIVSSSECHIVDGHPLPIVATGKSDYYTPYPEEPESLAEELAEVLGDFMGSAELKEKIDSHDTSVHIETKSLIQQFVDGLKSLLKSPAKDKEVTTEVGFKVIGNRWIATYSNNFEDLDGEYFPEVASKAFIERLDNKEIDMPSLRFWHIPVDLGDADAVAMIDHFMIATGEFRKDKLSQAWRDYFASTKKRHQVSHGFRYPQGAKQNNAFWYYNTFEISPLPIGEAANPYTEFELGVSDMGELDAKKRKELEAVLPPDLVDEMVQRLGERSKELKEAGVSFKEKPTLQVIDEAARNDIASVKSSVDSLAEQIETLVKALTPADKAKEAEDAKEEKRLSDFKKEVADLVESRMKSFMDLTPRKARNDPATEVPATHEHVKNLVEGQENGKIEGQKGRVMSHAFPTLYSNEGEV